MSGGLASGRWLSLSEKRRSILESKMPVSFVIVDIFLIAIAIVVCVT